MQGSTLDVRRQILTSKVGPRAVRVDIHFNSNCTNINVFSPCEIVGRGSYCWLLTRTPLSIVHSYALLTGIWLAYQCFPHITHPSSQQKTPVVNMAARIEAGASFSNWEEWNKGLENFKSGHQVELSAYCAARVFLLRGRLSPKIVQHSYDQKYAHAQYGCIHSGKPWSRSSVLRPNQSWEGLYKIVYNHPTLSSLWHPLLTGSPCQ